MKVVRRKMRDNGCFGPSSHKPSMKKEPSKLMKDSLKQLKRTRECFKVFKRDYSHVPVVPRTNNFASSSRPSNGMKSSHDNIKKSVSSSMMIVQKNTKMSRPSSLKPNNGVVSYRRNTNSSSSPSNSMDFANKSTNGGSLPLKNIENPRTSSSRLNSEASSSKNIKLPRSSLTRPNDDIFSLPMNIKKPKNGLAPLRRNTKSLKSRPTCLRNGSSSRLKDLDISKESLPSSIFGNSRIAAQMVNEAQKDDIPRASKSSNLSKLKANQDNTGIRHVSLLSKNLSSCQVAKLSCMVTNTRQHVEPMDGHIQLGNRKRNVSLSEDGRTHADKIKRKRMEPLLEEKLDTHEDEDSEVLISRSKKENRRFTKSMDCSIQLKNQNVSLVENGATISDNLRKRIEPLSGENPETCEDDDSEESEICRPTNRRRRLILTDCEDNDSGDKNLGGVENGTAGLTTQTAVAKDSSIEASNSFLSESLKLQQYGSLPIDEPVWSGSIKISERNVSLAAHLSTKCCEEVWKLAKSLQSEIVVTQLSRMEAWPKSFEASRPTDNNIALYFLPCQMRQDADLGRLVKEVMENDMVLKAVVGEAEMLIYPSILLPQQHQTFQGKPYLWAVFKRIKNIVATVEGKHGKERCAEDEMGKQQASHSSVDKEHSVARLNTDTGPEAREEMERQSMEQEQNHSLARANTASPATRDPTMNASTSANHCQIQSSLAVPTGALFGFVVQRNPRIEKLIQEMQREGAVVVAMQGEMIGPGLCQTAASGREEDKMPPSSS